MRYKQKPAREQGRKCLTSKIRPCSRAGFCPSTAFKNCSKRVLRCFFLILLLLFFPDFVNAQNTACPFDKETLQFAGGAVEQARCLLRPVKIAGNLGAAPEKLPAPLEKIIGKTIEIKKEKLRRYLLKNNFEENTLGGFLDQKLSKAKLPNGEETEALYFVIHDTSAPYLKDEPFPAEINDAEWRGNNLSIWKTQPVAHVFVNRAGESLTVVDFGEPVKRGFGTKFARDFLKQPAKGLQIHIELVQPRRRDKNRQPENNDAIAPVPGFTEKQYEKLALLYVAASLRRGFWLIPGFHAAVDAGIKDAHDDPQNFELEKFAEKLRIILKKL